MNDESSYPYHEPSDNPDTHYAILTGLVSTLIEDGQEAMADAWDATQGYWPNRLLDSLIRTAELKTLSAVAEH
jgi:hypothetical protein